MSRDPAMLNAFDASLANGLADTERRLTDRRARLLGPAYRLFYEQPLHLVRGEGPWLYDAAGRAFLDAYNNVPSIGHSHPEVTEAIARQAATLNTHTRYLHEGILDYAERLLATFPGGLGHVMFTCTGSEANDLALRIAGTHTGGSGVIVTDLAYHGVTSAVAAISPSLDRHAPLAAHVRAVPSPNRCGVAPAQVGAEFARHVELAIADLRGQGIRPAVLIVDTLFTSDGVYAHPPGFLAPAVEAIRRAGGLFIADEVQPGFGRTGDALWGFARHSVVPDLVTLGKPMGNGYPIAGVAMRPELVRAFAASRYFNTFGGNPVACAAAMATLNVIQRDRLQANAALIGRHLRSGYEAMARRHALINAVRGVGLFLGIELRRADGTPAAVETHRIVNHMRDHGVLISSTGREGNVLKLRPLLCFTQEHADLLLAATEEALAAL